MLVSGNRQGERCNSGLISHFISHFKWFYIFRIFKGVFSLAAGEIYKMNMLTSCVNSNWNEKYILHPNEDSNLFPNLFPKWIQICIRTRTQYVFFIPLKLTILQVYVPGYIEYWFRIRLKKSAVFHSKMSSVYNIATLSYCNIYELRFE